MKEKELVALFRKRQDTKINLCLSAAEAAMISGNYEDAERMFTYGLKWSEKGFGAQSAAVGLVLMSLVELYERDGKNRGTEHLENRIRAIFRRYFFAKLAEAM